MVFAPFGDLLASFLLLPPPHTHTLYQMLSNSLFRWLFRGHFISVFLLSKLFLIGDEFAPSCLIWLLFECGVTG